MENKCNKCSNCWKHCECIGNSCEKCQQETNNQKPKEKLFTFNCDTCDGYKENQRMHQAKVNGIGIDPNKLCNICDDCIKWVDVIKPKRDEGFM